MNHYSNVNDVPFEYKISVKQTPLYNDYFVASKILHSKGYHRRLLYVEFLVHVL